MIPWLLVAHIFFAVVTRTWGPLPAPWHSWRRHVRAFNTGVCVRIEIHYFNCKSLKAKNCLSFSKCGVGQVRAAERATWPARGEEVAWELGPREACGTLQDPAGTWTLFLPGETGGFEQRPGVVCPGF